MGALKYFNTDTQAWEYLVAAKGVAQHEAEADPHPQYHLEAEHGASGDPHPQYHLESEHGASGDPHPQYVLETTFDSTVAGLVSKSGDDVSGLLHLESDNFTTHLRMTRANNPIDLSQGTNENLYLTWENGDGYTTSSRWQFSPTGWIFPPEGALQVSGNIAVTELDVASWNLREINGDLRFFPGSSSVVRLSTGGSVWIAGGFSIPNASGSSNVLAIGGTDISNSPGVISEAHGYCTVYTRGTAGSSGFRVRGSTGTSYSNIFRVDTDGTIGIQGSFSSPDHRSPGDLVNGSSSTFEGCGYLSNGYFVCARSGNYVGYFNRMDSNGGVVMFRRDGSNVAGISASTTTVTYNTGSDYRLKENVRDAAGALDLLKEMRPVKHTWILDPEAGEHYGFLAHELQELVPYTVTGEKDQVDEHGNIDPQGVDHSLLVPILVSALQETIARLEALEGV